MAGTLLAAAEDADRLTAETIDQTPSRSRKPQRWSSEGDHRQHGRADQVEDQVDDRVLVEQAQLTEGEGGKDRHGSAELQDNDHGVGHLMRRWACGGQAGQLLLGQLVHAVEQVQE